MAEKNPPARAAATTPDPTTEDGSSIRIPSKKIRSITIGVAFAIVFASLGVGFAVGRVTAPGSGITGNSFTGFPGGGLRPGSGPGVGPGGGTVVDGGNGAPGPSAP
jgi:hypothetical protein